MKTFINKVFLVLACAAAMPFAKVDAQEAARDITLSQARELALEHNKDIAKSKLTLEQTQNDAKAYKTNYYPRINLMAADFYSTSKGDFSIAGGHLPIYMLNPATGTYVPNVTMGADGNYILNQYADFPSTKMDYKVGNIFLGGVSLTQPLYMGGKITAAYRMASRGAEMAEENIRLTESQVILNTDEAYMQAIRARQLADVARSYKQLLEELMKNVESAVRHGLKTRNDQMKVQVKLNEAELAIQRAENGIRLSTMNLCHVIGLPLNTPLQLDADQFSDAVPATIPTDGLSIDARPESAILQAKTDIASQQVKLTRSDYLPQLAMFAGYSYVNGIKLSGSKLLDTGAGAVGATLKVPLITFGERTYKLRSAKARQQIAQTEQQDLTEQMQLELAQAANNFDEAQTELGITQRSLEQAEENMRLARQQYDAGLEPLSQLLDAQAMWQQASADHVNAKCQLQVAHTKLLKAQGVLK
ncbi:MAG: TolC family protein [Bacteroidaceae bacterium]|nr:TolC family protein [Bacteroidaceae bacterium]